MKKIVEKYGVYDFVKEYTKIQENVKAYWLSVDKEDKLNKYIKFKFGVYIFKAKQKLCVLDFAGSSEQKGFSLPKPSAYILQEYNQGCVLLDANINKYSTEMIDDLLDYYTLDEVTTAFEEYKQGQLND